MRTLRVVLAVTVFARVAAAQSGRIVGSVHTPANEPLAGAQVLIASLALSASTRDDGTFVIRNVPPGTYDIETHRIGYQPAVTTGVVVRSGEDARVTVVLGAIPVQLVGVVVAASRHAESVIRAPASIAAFDAVTIGNQLGNPVTRLLTQAPGVSLTQVGVTSSFVNGRGFNKVFNSRWLTLEDGRVAAFAETGLTIGEHSTIPKVDIADIEVLAGPASSMYGASASSGLLSVRTKDPRQYPGVTIEVSGGSRDYRDAQFRYAGTTGKWGYKFAAQHQAVRDWTDTVQYPAVLPGGGPVREFGRHAETRVSRASGSLRYYLGDASRIEFNTGASLRDGFGQTTQGRYQIDGYLYKNHQLMFSSPRWLAQVYSTRANSGDTYRLNNLTQARARFPTLTDDSIRAIAEFPVDGRIEAAELQNNGMLGAYIRTGVTALDNSHITWGTQVRQDRVSSSRRVYSDAKTGEAIHFEQFAMYAQMETALSSSLRAIGAVRFDHHSRFPSRWSPKVGLVYALSPDRALRLTFNDAYLAPSILHTDLYSLNAAARLITVGNSDGFDVRDASGTIVNTIAPVGPETNQTWELGYKGVFGDRLFTDVTVSHSRFRNFMALVGPVANPFAASPTFAFNHRTGERYNDAAGNPLQTYTILNVGEGRFTALDAAMRLGLTDHVSVSSTMSLTRAEDIPPGPGEPPEASAFNTSAHRSTISVDVVDAPAHLRSNARIRYVQGYEFRSGSDWGRIPTHASLGVSASYRVSALGVTLLLQADNIVSCVGGTTAPPVVGISAASRATYTPRRKCGFGIRHHEILNMPAVGTMVFAGIRREW